MGIIAYNTLTLGAEIANMYGPSGDRCCPGISGTYQTRNRARNLISNVIYGGFLPRI